jgi:hypothetical protein
VRRAWIGFVAVVVGLLGALTAPASAQSTPELVAAPTTGLADGAIVTVDGTGWIPSSAGGSMTVGLCPSSILATPTLGATLCGEVVVFPIAVDDAGSFSVPLQVFRTETTLDGLGTLNCTGAGVSCVVFATEINVNSPTTTFVFASVPISFAATAKTDCRDGGWQSVTDANGDAFRNQGQCIRSVVGG